MLASKIKEHAWSLKHGKSHDIRFVFISLSVTIKAQMMKEKSKWTISR